MISRSRGRIGAWPRPTGWLAVSLISLAAPPALASGVVLVRSNDLPMYQETARAFRASYREPIHELSLAVVGPDQAVRDLRAAAPEVVVAVGLQAATLVHDRLPRTPMVYALVPSPERHDLVGSGVTGVAADVAPAAELGALQSLVPDVRSVGVVVGPDERDWTREATAAARRLGLQLEVATITSVDEVGPRVRDLLTRVEALWMPADPAIASPDVFRFMLQESVEHRCPLFTFAPGLVRAGALAAAAPDLDWVGRRAAEAVRRVQSGERAGDVPPTGVQRVHVFANLATARAIGRELPPDALRHAEVVQ